MRRRSLRNCDSKRSKSVLHGTLKPMIDIGQTRDLGRFDALRHCKHSLCFGFNACF